ncbi:MAG: DNA-processing protein DprA, partial [Planctomycetota bacterium]
MSDQRDELQQLRRGDANWPAELDEIESPPTTLWLRGRHELLGRVPRIGIVGTRSPSPYGVDQA